MAYDSPSRKFCTPATIAAAAERWPPPVSDEMIKILGTRGEGSSTKGPPFTLFSWYRLFTAWLSLRLESLHCNALRFTLRTIYILARLLHLSFEFLNLNQVLGIEW